MIKPIQITCNENYLFVLDEDGAVWRYDALYPQNSPKLIVSGVAK